MDPIVGDLTVDEVFLHLGLKRKKSVYSLISKGKLSWNHTRDAILGSSVERYQLSRSPKRQWRNGSRLSVVSLKVSDSVAQKFYATARKQNMSFAQAMEQAMQLWTVYNERSN